MMLIGYRMLFGELCTLLNVKIDIDADYVEDDYAREKLVSSVLRSIQGTDLEILVLSNDVYYLGLSVRICQNMFPPIMVTREMSERLAACSIRFQRELKKIGLFKYLDGKVLRIQDPTVIQCDKIQPMTA